MKRFIILLASFALSVAAPANQVFVVPTKISVKKLESGRQRSEAAGSFRDIRLSLAVVTGPKGFPLEAITGAVDGAAFEVDLKDFPPLEGVRASDMSVTADCCIMGAAFYWYIPWGKATSCRMDTTSGNRRGRVRKEVRIEVDGEGKVADVKIYDLCVR